MKLRVLTIPMLGGEENAKMNHFIGSYRVLKLEQRFAKFKQEAFFGFCFVFVVNPKVLSCFMLCLWH